MLKSESLPEYVARLTDENRHWDAAVLIAMRHGTTADQAKMEELERRHDARGYSEPSEIACRTALLAVILERLPIETASALRKGL